MKKIDKTKLLKGIKKTMANKFTQNLSIHVLIECVRELIN